MHMHTHEHRQTKASKYYIVDVWLLSALRALSATSMPFFPPHFPKQLLLEQLLRLLLLPLVRHSRGNGPCKTKKQNIKSLEAYPISYSKFMIIYTMSI